MDGNSPAEIKDPEQQDSRMTQTIQDGINDFVVSQKIVLFRPAPVDAPANGDIRARVKADAK